MAEIRPAAGKERISREAERGGEDGEDEEPGLRDHYRVAGFARGGDHVPPRKGHVDDRANAGDVTNPPPREDAVHEEHRGPLNADPQARLSFQEDVSLVGSGLELPRRSDPCRGPPSRPTGRGRDGKALLVREQQIGELEESPLPQRGSRPPSPASRANS